METAMEYPTFVEIWTTTLLKKWVLIVLLRSWGLREEWD